MKEKITFDDFEILIIRTLEAHLLYVKEKNQVQKINDIKIIKTYISALNIITNEEINNLTKEIEKPNINE